MEKRTLWSAAVAIVITVVAASSALAVSLQNPSDSKGGDPGTFQPSPTAATTPEVVTVYVDDTVPATAAGTPGASAPATAVTGSTVAHDDNPGDDHGGSGSDDHESDGRDDDD
jgi:hypothetical protein